MKNTKIPAWGVLIFLIIISSCACITSDELEVNNLRGSIINVTDLIGQTRGTGWVASIDDQYVIITAKHVLSSRRDIIDIPVFGDGLIELKDYQGREYRTRIISCDDNWDLDKYNSSDWVILYCPESWYDLPALVLSTESPYFGESVIWAGFGDTSVAAMAEEVIIGDEYGDSGIRRISGTYGAGSSGSPIYDPDLGVVGMLIRSYSETNHGIILDIPVIYDEIISEYYNDTIIF